MPNPNLFRRIYDAQQFIALRLYLKVQYITLFAGRIFCCDTGYLSMPFCRGLYCDNTGKQGVAGQNYPPPELPRAGPDLPPG